MKSSELWKGDIWSLDRRLLLWTKESSKTWAPTTNQYIGCYPLCTLTRTDTHTHSHSKTSVISLMYTALLSLSIPLQVGASQSAGKAQSSLLILFFCQSALFQLNEKLSLFTHKTPDFAMESITYQIKSEPRCIPPQTLACSHCNTVLIKLNNTRSSVLLLSKVGLCLWGKSRDSGSSDGEKGWGREEILWEPPQWHHYFPTRKEKEAERPGFFFGSHYHAVETKKITMILFTRVNGNHRD